MMNQIPQSTKAFKIINAQTKTVLASKFIVTTI